MTAVRRMNNKSAEYVTLIGEGAKFITFEYTKYIKNQTLEYYLL